MNRKVQAFVARLRRGEIVKTLYLTYYYAYLTLYDRRHGTNFSNSQAPEDMGSEPSGGAGNFPAHPQLVKRFLRSANLRLTPPSLMSAMVQAWCCTWLLSWGSPI